jgi:DNA replication protein DnaD
MDIISPVVATVAGLVISLISSFFAKAVQSRQEQVAKEIERLSAERSNLQKHLLANKVPIDLESPQGQALSETTSSLYKSIEDRIIEVVAQQHHEMSVEEIKSEVTQHVSDLKERLEKIESRFPEDAQLEKIASVNDALLAERIEQLAKQISGIEEKILSKWDVAVIVSTILTSIIGIVSLTITVLRYFSG